MGAHTSFFLDRDCDVTSTDIRESNLAILRETYPGLKTRLIDVQRDDAALQEQFEVVYCYGVLYHLERPSQAIEFMAEHSSQLILLETCVTHGDEPAVNLCREDSLDPTQSATGYGCRPTRTWVRNELLRHFEFVYLPVTQPNHPEFPIDWTRPSIEYHSRSVFIGSRQKLDNPLLCANLPVHQRRH